MPASHAPPWIIPEERINRFLHEPFPLDPVDPVAAALLAMNPVLDGAAFEVVFRQGRTYARFVHLNLPGKADQFLATKTAIFISQIQI
jgi:hypothetical protein